MDCNKEDAIKAMQLAERKMQHNDFTGARKLAQKAQRLFLGIENITQLLAVCEVHCAAECKLGGCEMDWYGILQVQRFSHEAIIKNQYKQLRLLLHPDKNKFAGAESAFKLTGEAKADDGSRFRYDMKCRVLLGTGIQNSPESWCWKKGYEKQENELRKVQEGRDKKQQEVDRLAKELEDSEKEKVDDSTFEFGESLVTKIRATADTEHAVKERVDSHSVLDGGHRPRRSPRNKYNPSSSSSLDESPPSKMLKKDCLFTAAANERNDAAVSGHKEDVRENVTFELPVECNKEESLSEQCNSQKQRCKTKITKEQ